MLGLDPIADARDARVGLGIAGSGIADAVMLGVGLEIAGKWGCSCS